MISDPNAPNNDPFKGGMSPPDSQPPLDVPQGASSAYEQPPQAGLPTQRQSPDIRIVVRTRDQMVAEAARARRTQTVGQAGVPSQITRPNYLPPAPAQSEQEDQPRRRGRAVIGMFAVGLSVVGLIGIDDVAFGGKHIQSLTRMAGFNSKTVALSSTVKVIGNAPVLPAPTTTEAAIPSPTPTIAPTTKAPAALVLVKPTAEQCVDSAPDSFLIAQKIMAPVEGVSLAKVQKAISDRYVGGVILMSSPVNPNDGSILAFKNAQKVPIEAATAQEGGDPVKNIQKAPISIVKVPNSTLEPNGYMPTAAEMATKTPAEITALVTENYSYLKKIGINTSFIVLDVAPVSGVPGIGASRLASSNPDLVIKYAEAFIAGAKKAGVNPVAKYLGVGSASADTTLKPAITPAFNLLQQRDLLPYLALKTAGIKVGGMIGSQIIPGLTEGKDGKVGTVDDIPANMSRTAVTDQFKKNYLSEGVNTYTNDLGTASINMPVAEAAIRAMMAGVDETVFGRTTWMAVNSLIPSTDPNKPATKPVTTARFMSVTEQVDAVIAEGVKALKDGRLNRKEVVNSVDRLLLAKNVSACRVLEKVDPAAYKKLTQPKPNSAPTAPVPAPTTATPALVAPATIAPKITFAPTPTATK